jgi:hypothetical protein
MLFPHLLVADYSEMGRRAHHLSPPQLRLHRALHCVHSLLPNPPEITLPRISRSQFIQQPTYRISHILLQSRRNSMASSYVTLNSTTAPTRHNQFITPPKSPSDKSTISTTTHHSLNRNTRQLNSTQPNRETHPECDTKQQTSTVRSEWGSRRSDDHCK